MNIALGVLMASALLWIASMTRVEAPKPILKPLPAKAVLQISCDKHGKEERDRICRARERMEKVKANLGVM